MRVLPGGHLHRDAARAAAPRPRPSTCRGCWMAPTPTTIGCFLRRAPAMRRTTCTSTHSGASSWISRWRGCAEPPRSLPVGARPRRADARGDPRVGRARGPRRSARRDDGRHHRAGVDPGRRGRRLLDRVAAAGARGLRRMGAGRGVPVRPRGGHARLPRRVAALDRHEGGGRLLAARSARRAAHAPGGDGGCQRRAGRRGAHRARPRRPGARTRPPLGRLRHDVRDRERRACRVGPPAGRRGLGSRGVAGSDLGDGAGARAGRVRGQLPPQPHRLRPVGGRGRGVRGAGRRGRRGDRRPRGRPLRRRVRGICLRRPSPHVLVLPAGRPPPAAPADQVRRDHEGAPVLGWPAGLGDDRIRAGRRARGPRRRGGRMGEQAVRGRPRHDLLGLDARADPDRAAPRRPGGPDRGPRAAPRVALRAASGDGARPRLPAGARGVPARPVPRRAVRAPQSGRGDAPEAARILLSGPKIGVVPFGGSGQDLNALRVTYATVPIDRIEGLVREAAEAARASGG